MIEIALVLSLLQSTAAADPSPPGGLASPASPSRWLTFEDRVAAQRAIEAVFWRHRVWPKENRSAKPAMETMISEATLLEKVRENLRKTTALENWWGRPVTGEQLQDELDRMARNTNDSRMLRELFDALGNDPFVIAETLGRQVLVDRLVRNAYATDDRIHGDLKRAATSALLNCADLDCMDSLGGEFHASRTNESAGTGERLALDGRERAPELGAREWAALRPKLTEGRDIGALEETADSFVAVAVASGAVEGTIRASVVWRKRAFGDWWRSTRFTFSETIPATSFRFTLPTIATEACVNDTWKPTFQDVPDPRAKHTALWTGAEMIVWGGAWNDGGRYDPATDTWTVFSVGPGIFHARGEHTAVWTGTEMIVWGGTYTEGATPTTVYPTVGGRYNPSTNTWTSTSDSASVLSGRIAHSAVWTGSTMIIWGGYGPPAGATNTGAKYDPVTDTWTPTSMGTSVALPRWYHTAVWTGTEMIVWGGTVAAADQISGGRYDPLLDRWLPTSILPGVPAGRTLHSAIWTGSEMIVWGGSSPIMNTGGRYDPALDQWTPTSVGTGVPTAREHHTAVWTGTEMIIWGGTGPFGGSSTRNTGGRYDPTTDRWAPISTGPNVPSARNYHTAVWTGTEMIVWGGYDGLNLNSGGRYDPSQDQWVPTSIGGSVPSAREVMTTIWTGSEMIVWGGFDPTLGLHNTGGRYRPATDSWVPTSVDAGVPSPRVAPYGLWTGTRMIVWGGPQTNTGGLYDPLADAWMSMSTVGTAARESASAVWTGHDMVVWGGSLCTPSCSGSTNTGVRYDPETDAWTPTLTGANVPSARSGHVAVVVSGDMIVWGGSTASNVYTNTGARYALDTGAWTPIATGASAPAARGGYRGVGTGNGMIVWGDSATQNKSKTGGRFAVALNQWLPMSIGASTPVGRDQHSAVWTGSEMVVWGGYVPNGRTETGGRYDPVTDQWVPTSIDGSPEARTHTYGVWTGSSLLVWGGERNGAETASGGAYCACPEGRLVYVDADADGHGDARRWVPICDGTIPAGYSASSDDCDDGNGLRNPGAIEECNGTDDDCDGLVDDDTSGEDADGDGIAGACDNCPLDPGRSQSDTDHDGQGDVCDLDDGAIWEWRDAKTSVSWQAEQGPTSWNVYLGNLDTLKATGIYTQAPGSNALASRICGMSSTSAPDLVMPETGETSFSLVTGVTAGIEGSLGSSSTTARPNANPCP